MNNAVKQQWVAALRSGDYVQGKYTLRTFDKVKPSQSTYCCLGVLCDLYSKACEVPWQPIDGVYLFYGRADLLPQQVIEWVGLTSNNPVISRGNGKEELSQLNDRDHSFLEIADLIEHNL